MKPSKTPKTIMLSLDIKAKHLLFLYKRLFGLSKAETAKAVELLGKEKLSKCLSDLDLYDKCRFILKLAVCTNQSIYILKDFIFGMPPDLRRDFLELADELKSSDRVLIDLVTMDSFTIDPNITSTINYKSGQYLEVK